MTIVRETKHVGFRFPTEDIKLLQSVSEARGEDMSDFVRRATRKELARLNYLSRDEKKALGINLQQNGD